MQFSDKRSIIRSVIIVSSFLIVILILWNTYYLFQLFKDEERMKMELWSSATEAIFSPTEDKALETLNSITNNNTTIPIILTDARGVIQKSKNIDPAILDGNIVKDSIQAYKLLEKFKADNNRLTVEYLPGEVQYVYYGNSTLLNVLKYYPMALALIIVLFGAVVYNFYRATKAGAQNRLWAGMAKETAHQIGTPLSSLLGWIEIMKIDNVDETTVTEVEKDVSRLQTIAERFSKIGSEPVLEERDIIAETEKSFDYLKARASKQVVFNFSAPDYPVMAMLNPELHSWTIENLVKNAIDAMKGKGSLDVIIEDREKYIKIKVCDSGKGMAKGQFKKVFEPGFTTKKRGWGLGLSLTKRIVEEYHKGKIKVLSSEVGKGTIMQASFPKK
ncbi:sensor histidine kinase [Flavobacterium arcticum]|uniref:histidine kinase n=1 Tax=Flavobacterium arcticum TaxID=1784713 RepID=A0A345HC05_9FLAO|nr:HAMP domain-containing sensor histidine kinase [Flavobacterium arcticum]AXG74115.1 sensor histidine kinase [Flavobacterium arcticum]KAF2507325.1 HAMP domain-containing histidine kinase [Flavobacterium arcticum]